MKKVLKNKNKNGFAMAELLAVSIVVLFIFSILFSNYLPLVAEYESKLSYNDVTAQYAAHNVRKIYLKRIETDKKNNNTTTNIMNFIDNAINTDGYYKPENIDNICVGDEQCKKILNDYGIEEVIITKYKLGEGDNSLNAESEYVKNKYKLSSGSLYKYIQYLPNYEKSIYTGKPQEAEELYRIILKTKDFGYATTPIFSDYKTPGSCFDGEKNGDGITITKYRYDGLDCGNVVTISPNSVCVYNGNSGKVCGVITAIGDKVFANESGSKSYQVEQVILSNNVKSIGNSAFEGSSLNQIDGLGNVTSIGESAFRSSSLKEVELTTLNKFIGDYAFAEIKNLETIKLPSNNIIASDSNNVLTKGLFSGSGIETVGIKVKIPGGMINVGEEMFYLAKINSLTLENGVEVISKSAFSQNSGNNNMTGYGIEELKIPSSVKTIGNHAFDSLQTKSLEFEKQANGEAKLNIIGDYSFRKTGISSLAIPSNVSSIGMGAFDHGGFEYKVKELVFEKNEDSKLTTIGNYAFRDNEIKAVVIPDSVTTMGTGAFSQNSSLNTVTLSNSLSKITAGMFYDCPITKITIPNSVESIGNRAFALNSVSSILSEIEINENESNLKSIASNAFSGQASLTKFVVPKSVTDIGEYAFGGCTDLIDILNYSSVDFSVLGCGIFSDDPGCNITKENNYVYINVPEILQKKVTNMGGAINE